MRLALLAALLLALPVSAEEKKDRDIYDHAGQAKAGKDIRKIVLIAGTEPHGGRGNHEFMAAAVFLARTLNENYPNAWAVVHSRKNFPKDLSHADAVIIGMDHGGMVADNKEVEKAMKRGAGFMALHYGVEVNRGKQVERFLAWMGGCFEPFFSVNPWWTPEFQEMPKHPTTRGVKPIKANDEWYYHMRFVKDMKGVTPILSAVPPLKTVTDRYKEGDKAGSHHGNPDVLASVKAGKATVVAWAYDRPEGGRGFGFTGMHKHDNWGDEGFRTLLANAAAWVSGLEVP
ncbi:MAG: ThuA domain-containing protein, partial [Gemmataceae bacterium]|nr:ThuA domain-containing protein [Gemmataceae bacterium]